MRLLALVCALGLVSAACSGKKTEGSGQEQLSFSVLPDGLPDTSDWQVLSGQDSEPIGGVAAAKAGGIQFAQLLVDEGLCPDSDEDCLVTLRYELFRTSDERTGALQALFRWVLAANGKRIEGVARAARNDAGGPVRYSYWRRTRDAWIARAEGTPEYDYDHGLHDTLGALLQHVLSHKRQ